MITTPRLFLLPLSREMLTARLTAERFALVCPTPEGPREVSFGPEWPGNPLSYFPFFLDGLGPEDDEVDGSFAVIERGTGVCVGMAGTKWHPDDDGNVEIGYGINESARGRGLATETVGALVVHLLSLPHIRRVTAETAVANAASERVLERCAFARAGTSWNEADGDLVVWARE